MAVLSILYGMDRIRLAKPSDKTRPQRGLGLQVRRKLLAFFLVSVFAICGTLPLVMVYFNQVSLIGLLANFIIVPLVGLGVIPCGLLALFVYPLSSSLALIGVKLCVFVLDMVLVIIGFLADRPPECERCAVDATDRVVHGFIGRNQFPSTVRWR